MKSKFWEFKNLSSEVAELYIYNEIIPWEDEDMTSSASFKKDLEEIGEVSELKIHINSPGGSVFDGIAIASMIKRFKGTTTCYVDGLAASIASVIAASCDRVVMPNNSMQMIHNALTGGFMFANAKEFRKMADDLDKISASIRQSYLSKSNGKVTEEQLVELMDRESWLSADECLAYGLCDEVVSANKMVASVPTKFNSLFNNIPKQLINTEGGDEVEENKELKDEEVEVHQENESVATEELTEDVAVEEGTQEASDDEVDTRDEEIERLKNEIEQLKAEKEDLQTKYNGVSETVIDLNTQIANLQEKASKYDKNVHDEKVAQAKNYYKDKFEGLNAKAKFDSKEIQDLIVDSVDSIESKMQLNEMLLNLVPKAKVENKAEKIIQEASAKVEDLLPNRPKSFEERYGY